MMTQRSVGNN
uniref:Uncharacterized protein n=1 Tax=Anguilla anguilla TaxID=7936 RepID=A0A0E9XF47_ANGAN